METTNNNTATKTLNQDPRIDSPQIKVVYPSVALRPKDPIKPVEKEIVQSPISTAVSTPTTVIDSSEQTPSRTETHVCVVTWQNAIKQNASTFLLLGAGILAIGYFLGKNKG